MIQPDGIITANDLIKVMEPVIRRVIREELERMAENKPEIFYIEADMPLYEDMLEIRKRHKGKKTKLYSHQEVWGE
ncbi:MAG: hypothetical protein JJV92_04310 [Desulfosarcina sp.]|nr:hypothetical protein [Desulfobacterales bacterium]